MNKENIKWVIIFIVLLGYSILHYSIEVIIIIKVLTLLIISIISVIESNYMIIRKRGVIK